MGPICIRSQTSSDNSTSSPDIYTLTTAPDLQASTFSSFVNQQQELVVEDDIDSKLPFDGTLPNHRPAAQTTRLPLLKLTKLFDFNNTHWATPVRSAQEDSFEKELEFYELLDLDTEGEDDLDVADTTQRNSGPSSRCSSESTSATPVFLWITTRIMITSLFSFRCLIRRTNLP